jgi:hypothetical protein
MERGNVVVLANTLIIAVLVAAGFLAAMRMVPRAVPSHAQTAERLASATRVVRVLNKTFGSLDITITNGRREVSLGQVGRESAREFAGAVWPDEDGEIRLMGRGRDGAWISRGVRSTPGDLIMWDVEPYQRVSHVRVLKRD